MGKSLKNKLVAMALGSMVVVAPTQASTNVAQITIASEEAVTIINSWEDEVATATLLGEINVWKANSDTNSMASAFFTKTNVPFKVENGKVTLKIQVTKDALGLTDVITSLEQKMQDGTYKTLELEYADDADVRYIVAELEVEEITEPIVVRCGIRVMPIAQELRIVLTQDTIDAINVELAKTI